MSELREILDRLMLQSQARKFEQRLKYGFVPFGIAMNYESREALRELFLRNNQYVFENKENYPDMLCGLRLFSDPKIERHTFEVISEEEARRRGYMEKSKGE